MKDAVTMRAWTKRQRQIRRRARKWAKQEGQRGLRAALREVSTGA